MLQQPAKDGSGHATSGNRQRHRPMLLVGVIAEADGQYGHISVRDADGLRSLCCGALCHGSSYLESAGVGVGATHAPGPVPEGSYPLGWSFAALPEPDGHLLMGGLGAGAGVTMLLHEFPELRITVVEIDPVVIRLARAHFPLLDKYVSEQRLSIISADLLEVAQRFHRPTWSSALIDLYQESSILHCPADLLVALRACTGNVWLNILDGAGRERVHHSCEVLRAAGWSPRSLIPTVSIHDGLHYQSGNFFLGTAPIDALQARCHRPFADRTDALARSARQHYAGMLELVEPIPNDSARGGRYLQVVSNRPAPELRWRST